ncbi:hypothetical protein ABZ719_36550 [Streptomyces sp. NPDC006743]|uniref:hypothetical protein n=1 Tax=Streptomyces sp. NPDC006743 TaxID=3154480 RepID=UPI00345309FE
MLDQQGPSRDLASFALPEIGQLLETGDPWEPYRLVDPTGEPVRPVALYFKDLLASNSPASTLYSYGNDLLRWWRFLWALGIEWDRATREHARDFMLWMRLADKPVRLHWRHRGKPGATSSAGATGKPAPGTPNPVTGKPTIGTKYAESTRAHCETVLRTFYDFHLDNNSGSLLINPFPLDRSRRRGRANAHHNPMDKFKDERTGRYRHVVAPYDLRRNTEPSHRRSGNNSLGTSSGANSPSGTAGVLTELTASTSTHASDVPS